MNIIITGASGFVGANLGQYLKENGHNVMGLSLRSDDWVNQFDREAYALIHLAGKAHDTSNVSKPEEYFEVNRDLTVTLFDKFLDSNIRDFFYFSSVKAVADSVGHTLIEEVEGAPSTPYGRSKLEAEEYLLSKSLPEGKRLFIIRPCMIHGPGNRGNLNLLYKVVKKGVPWPLAAFNNKRSFLSIDNLSFLIEKILLNENVSSGVYNFADDDVVSTNDLVSLISNILGKKPRLWRIPISFVKTIGKLGDVLPIPLNSERLKKLTESYRVSNAKIKRELGLDELPITVRDGLKKTIRSFQ